MGFTTESHGLEGYIGERNLSGRPIKPKQVTPSPAVEKPKVLKTPIKEEVLVTPKQEEPNYTLEHKVNKYMTLKDLLDIEYKDLSKGEVQKAIDLYKRKIEEQLTL